MTTLLRPMLSAAIFVEPWQQQYHQGPGWGWYTLLAAVPLVVLLVLMLGVRMKAHIAAVITVVVALAICIAVFHMPATLAVVSTLYGAAYGLWPIYWIVFPVIFLYELTVKAGRFALLQQCLTGITEDGRLQLLLIAFAFGAFFEGASGFGTPVAVCGTLLIGFGFDPVRAAALALLANTAPVAFGALGAPAVALAGVTGLDLLKLTRCISMLLTPFCVIVPFWLICAFCGWEGMLEIWPAVLVAGVLFGSVQCAIAVLHGPWLVDIVASLVTIVALVGMFRVWKPKRLRDQHGHPMGAVTVEGLCRPSRADVVSAFTPWAILTVFVGIWGAPPVTAALDRIGLFKINVPLLHLMVSRMPPVVPVAHAEAAVFNLNLLSATGTGIFIAAIVSGLVMGLSLKEIFKTALFALHKTRFTAITIATLMGFGFLSRYCGLDGVLGLAFARTGALYPIFGTLIGWLGTASTGSDTSSNVLFGSLQKLTAQQLGLSPILMAAANSGGGVMGKMVAPQSVVVASTATGTYGKEGAILRQVAVHSFVLAFLCGVLVLIVVHVPALSALLVK